MRMSNQTDRVIFPNSIFRQKHNTSCWYQFLDFTYDSNRELQSRALICICLKSTKSTDVTMRVFFVVKMTENSSIIKCSRQFSKVPCMRACVWARTQIVDACSHTSNQQPTTVMRMSNHTDRVIFPNSVFSTKTQYIVLISVFGFHIWSKSGATKSCPDLHMFEINKSADVTMRVFFVVKMTENSSIIKSFKLSTVLDSSMHNMRACVWARTQIIDARTLANSSLKQYWVCRNIQIELSSQIQFFDENTIHRVDISFWISHMIQIESYKVVPWFAYVWNQQNLLMSQCVFSLSWKWQITHS
jgi:phage-related protein